MRYWWIIPLIIYYVIYNWMSVKNNQTSNNYWYVVMFIYGALCPFWVIVSRYSRSLMLDGILYDFIMLITYYGTMIYLDQAIKFAWWQWVAVVMIFVGMIIIRIDPGLFQENIK